MKVQDLIPPLKINNDLIENLILRHKLTNSKFTNLIVKSYYEGYTKGLFEGLIIGVLSSMSIGVIIYFLS